MSTREQRLSSSIMANQALFAALPEAARGELEEMFGDLGQEVLALQQKLVPVGTRSPRDGHVPGQLKAALTVDEAIADLQVRIGLPDKLGRRSRLFYAVIQHYGRKAQTVKIRRGKRKGADMRVRAMPGIPFVFGINVDALIEKRLGDFWDRVQGRAGG